MMHPLSTPGWQFWIDRGGTFTDIVARRPDGTLLTHKLLSENPERYADAAVQGIREILAVPNGQPLPIAEIATLKMGTTVATNALLERKGDRTLLLITQGFRDALRIGYQNRPYIFARRIILPDLLYERVIEVEERCSAQGEVLVPLNLSEALKDDLQAAYDAGIRSCAIVFMHGDRYPAHEQRVAELVRSLGFTQVSVSHEVSPLMKLISRGDTTVVDAYLSPVLRRYIATVMAQLNAQDTHPPVLFMQSNGGLMSAQQVKGKDSILSGPAGGIVGAVQTCAIAGLSKIITFDMGGTSTDVAHYNGEYERVFQTEIAGVRLRTPMMAIHTVAAGGGSILTFDGSRFRVGPESAGATPGPACYRRGGPLTVTDCNVMLGKLIPEFFPQVFGEQGNQPLDISVVHAKFADLTQQIQAATQQPISAEAVAQGFLAIAVEKMANAIKKISIQRGYDVTDYTLCCFGGAGGQHACLIADALGMKQVFLHPYAGVLSAYGMGLADQRVLKEQGLEAVLTDAAQPELEQIRADLTQAAIADLQQQSSDANTQIQMLSKAQLRYAGTDFPLLVDWGNPAEMQRQFHQLHQQQYGFTLKDKALIVEAVLIEGIAVQPKPIEPTWIRSRPISEPPPTIAHTQIYTQVQDQVQAIDTPVYQRTDLEPGDRILGPAIITESTSTIIVEPSWCAECGEQGQIFLKKVAVSNALALQTDRVAIAPPDPVKLEIFIHGFQAIAEQMGITLQNTSYSVNIKERLDFSCAIFDAEGHLVANAPHIPVHLGSMSASIENLIATRGDQLKPGDVYVSNNPYGGGTHLPDITVMTPIWHGDRPIFYVASRGHHADIGGRTPGSMPPHSTTVIEEGILLDNVCLVEAGEFQGDRIIALLQQPPYPARNPAQNLADLKAQIAANEQGANALTHLVQQHGLATVQTYMQHVQDQAEAAVRNVIRQLKDGQFTYEMDDGHGIQVKIQVQPDAQSLVIDFSGTSAQQLSNLNAPLAVCQAAVLYVFRTLINDEIPLNAGCLKPLTINVPPGCLLNPAYPAAVVAGNVETSQAIVDALYGALGVMAASQGTMNNFTFGNDEYQYYETICGGSGASADFDGTDAVQTHMTNSRLTDPEVLEWRFPVVLEAFAIRPNSGGLGLHHGGNGVIRRLRFQQPMSAAILSEHRRVPPFGLQGGNPGALGRNWVERCDGTIEHLASRAEVQLEPGDIFGIATPGGGGFDKKND